MYWGLLNVLVVVMVRTLKQDYALGSGKKTVRGEIGNGVGVSVDTDADADDEDDDASTSIVPPAQPRVNVLR